MARFGSRSKKRRFSRWAPYVRQAERHGNAARQAISARKGGAALTPVRVVGRTIASSFWGKAWCDNLEAYSDYGNRLPRGRTYVRNGSVIDLKIVAGVIEALVSGSSIYTTRVTIAALPAPRWRALTAECSGQIGSLLDLLQGRFSRGVMQVLARRDAGLFPAPKDIAFSCSCPDIASMCKHVAAVLYGVGARFDAEPGLFFTLRQVNSEDLIAAAAGAEGLAAVGASAASELAGEDLASVFGIDLEAAAPAPAARPIGRRKRVPQGDGFDEVFGPGLEMTTDLLLGFGVPRSTFAGWVRNGVLVRTGRWGVYKTTEVTLDRFRRVQARQAKRG